MPGLLAKPLFIQNIACFGDRFSSGSLLTPPFHDEKTIPVSIDLNRNEIVVLAPKTSRTGMALTGLILILCLVTPYFLGSLGAYFQILCTLIVTGVLLLTRQRLALAGDPGFKLLILAFIILSIAFMLGARDWREMSHALNFTMLLFFGPVAAYLARFATPKNTRGVASLALLGAFCATTIALFQVFILKDGRATGWGTDPIWSAEAALILGFLAALGATTPTRWRALYLIGPLLGVVTCIASGSRGPLLAVPFLLLVLVFISPRRWWLVLVAAVSVAILLWIGLEVFWPEGLRRLDTLVVIGRDLLAGKSIAEHSGATRQEFYSASLGAFMHAPWVGYGWTNKMVAIVPYLPGNGAALIAPHLHLHSDVLDFAVSGGLGGLIAYALILVAPIAAAFAGPHDSQFRARLLGVLLLAVGYFICGLTYLMFGYEFLTTLYICLATILIGYCRDRPPLGAST